MREHSQNQDKRRVSSRRFALRLWGALGLLAGGTALGIELEPKVQQWVHTGAPGDGQYNVLAFGATGDGHTDDTAAIQAALNAASARGGGVVYLPPGTYAISMGQRQHASDKPLWGALMVGAKTTLRGGGRDATTLLLAPKQPSGNGSIIWNAGPGDAQITFEDFTLDGNARNQPVPPDPSANNNNGITMSQAHGVTFHRVRVQNVKGTTTLGIPKETLCFEVGRCVDVLFSDCEVLRTSDTPASITSTGFSADASANVLYTNCVAHDLANGYGFTHSGPSGCQQIVYENCASYLNVRGFNSESSQNILYANCVAGGLAASATSTYPFAPDQHLGNSGQGFNIASGSHIHLSNCISQNNLEGLQIEGASAVHLTGGSFYGNQDAAINLKDRSSARATHVKNVDFGSPPSSIRIVDTVLGSSGKVSIGAVPPSGTLWPNPLPFDTVVYVGPAIGSNLGQIQIGEEGTGVTFGSFRVPSGGSITLSYTGAAPSVLWFIDP
jgi:hypothetical protein